MSLSATVNKLTAEYGGDITYRRIVTSAYDPATRTAGSTTTTDYSLKASVRDLKPHEISGTLQFGDRVIRIAGDSLPITPKQNDLVIVGSKTYRVAAVDDIVVKGDVIQYKITAAGDAN